MMKYRPDIDGLRAVAVLSVLVFHVDPKLLPGGFVGVDMFFVISGYLISIILWEAFSSPSFSFLAFYARRAQRLFPALYATVACTLLTALAWFPRSTTESTAVSAVSALASVSNIRFATQAGYFDSSALRKPLLHTWSLAVEEQFYLVWPLLLKLIHDHQHRFSRQLVLPVIAFLACASELCTRQYPSFAYFLAPFRFYEFLIGASLHLVATLPYPTQEVLAVSGLLAMLYSLRAFSNATPFPGFGALLPTVATAALIHSPQSTIARMLSVSPLTVLGRVSYSVYLVHWPLIVAARLLSDRELVPEESAFLLIASLVLGLGLHHAVETRFRPAKSSASCGTRHPARTLASFFVVGLLLCIVAYGATELARTKHARAASSLMASATNLNSSRLHPIDGMNLTALRVWATKLDQNKPWYYIIGQGPSKVEGYRAWGLAYRPKRKPARARMLLIGDSHMGSLAPAFMRIAAERNFEVDGRLATGCAPLFGTRSMSRRAPHRAAACIAQQKKWETFIAGSRYDFVVMAARWQWLTEESVYGDFWMPAHGVVGPDGKVPKSIHERRRIFEEGLRRTVAAVLRTGAHVVLVSQVPNVGKYEVSGCLERGSAKKDLQEGRQPAGCLGVTRATSMTRSYLIDKLVTLLGNENAQVTAAVPSNYFCDNWEDSYCRSVFDARELYKDNSHVTEFGALFFSQRWQEDSFSGNQWTHRNEKKMKAGVSGGVRYGGSEGAAFTSSKSIDPVEKRSQP